jgi:hypothetical protein
MPMAIQKAKTANRERELERIVDDWLDKTRDEREEKLAEEIEEQLRQRFEEGLPEELERAEEQLCATSARTSSRN